MRKRKFQYIANNESYFIGKEVILNGKFRIFQEQYSEVDFKNDKFTIIDILDNGSFKLKGQGYGLIFADVNNSTEEHNAMFAYGEGPFILTKKEVFKIGRQK